MAKIKFVDFFDAQVQSALLPTYGTGLLFMVTGFLIAGNFASSLIGFFGLIVMAGGIIYMGIATHSLLFGVVVKGTEKLHCRMQKVQDKKP